MVVGPRTADYEDMSKIDMNNKRATTEWSPAKLIRKTYGITAPQLRRYAKEGMIRSSNIRRPGQVRGIRLFNVGDIDKLIEASIEPASGFKSVPIAEKPLNSDKSRA